MDFAKKLLGKIGVELWYELRGEAVYSIKKDNNQSHQASLGKTKTFTPPSSEKAFVRAQLLRNVESAFIKLRRHKLRAGALSVFLTDHEYHNFGLYMDFTRPTAATMEAVQIASDLFEAIFDASRKYRRSGVVLNALEVDALRKAFPQIYVK